MPILQSQLQDNKKEPQKGSGVLQVHILLNEISDGNGIANVNQHRIKALGHFESFIHGVVHQVLTFHTDDAVVFALFQQADCMITHRRSVYTVTQRENRRAGRGPEW